MSEWTGALSDVGGFQRGSNSVTFFPVVVPAFAEMTGLFIIVM